MKANTRHEERRVLGRLGLLSEGVADVGLVADR